MAEDHRSDFIEWARRARAKPAFDLEEREYRLEIASAVRQLIDAAREGRPLADAVEQVGTRLGAGLVMAVPAGQIRALAAWDEHDPEGLTRALVSFADAGDDPERRIVRFAESLATAPQRGEFAAGGLVVGSLLNFAVAPERLPIVRPAHYARIAETLGEEIGPSGSVVVDYRRHLALARTVKGLLESEGVPVRDMLDVESLIAICALERELWAGSGDAADSRREAEPDVALAACLMYRNEARYLAEWLEFHLLVGVERFYLYDHGSEDDHLAVLEPYLEEGTVILHPWGEPDESAQTVEHALELPLTERLHRPAQRRAYDHCLAEHGAEARWIAFIDADEFLFSPTGRPLPEVLADYGRWPAVAVNSPRFGASGHTTAPEGLVLANYTMRLENEGARFVKSIVDPGAATACIDAHSFRYRRGTAVDENGYPVSWIMTKSASFERLRINHYYLRTEQELRDKRPHRLLSRIGATAAPAPATVPDDTIASYVPALREALARRSRSRTA